MRYERSAGLREAVFEASELYWLIRDSYSTSTNMEEVRYEEYRSVIEARAESTVQSAERYGGGPAFTGYELTLFELKDSFEGSTRAPTRPQGGRMPGPRCLRPLQSARSRP